MIFVILNVEEVCSYLYLCPLSYAQVFKFVALACAALSLADCVPGFSILSGLVADAECKSPPAALQHTYTAP